MHLSDYFGKIFGVSGLSEKRQKDFFISLIKFKYNKKLLLFCRFLGMDESSANYSDMDFRIYLESMHELVITNKRGFDIKIDINKGLNYIPYIRAYDFINQYLPKKNRLDNAGVTAMNEILLSIRKQDAKNINLDGFVDFDLMMFHLYNNIRIGIENYSEILNAIF